MSPPDAQRPAAATLADLCFTSLGNDRTTRRLRTAQMDALAAMLPVTNAVAVFNASLLTIALWNSVPQLDLLVWLGTFGLLVAVRIYQVLGRGRRRATPRSIYLLVLCSAALWATPPLLWHDDGAPLERVLIFMTTAGMMCGGCVVLATMPVACWTYLAILGGAIGGIALHLGEPILTLMTLGYTAMLCWAGLRHALRFIEHQRDRMELEERGELVKLMREFEASGSGWLWELDANLRLTYMSNDEGRWSPTLIDHLLGRDARTILDPVGRIAIVSEGVRALFRHFDEAKPFRDIAVPTVSGRWWALSGKPVFGPDGSLTGWRGLGSDITEVRLNGNDAVHAARRDPLTGLANRLLVREQIEEALLCGEDGGCALVLVDLDRFKLVNDTLGHRVGDQLLKEVADRLRMSVSDAALVGRLGGDEFAIIWPRTLDRAALAEIAERVISDLSQTYEINGIELNVGATIGIAMAPDDSDTQEELICSADLALYRAKEEGRGTHCFYARSMGERAHANRQLESDLRCALKQGGLSLVYQPIVGAHGGAIVGYEALLRWRHPVRGEIPPGEFVPVIEDIGLINRIGSWVIHEACAQAATWRQPLRIAVNVSAAQITGPTLVSAVIAALDETGLDAGRLEIEVTESIFLGDDDLTLASLERLRALGVRLVIDDFGKGYSSFGYLSRARFSKIKIDQEFVQGAAAGNREHLAIVEAILALARRLDVETTAEGVETVQQERVMGALGCGQFQGFRFGRPVPAELIALGSVRSLRRIA